ncbi:MAG: hypothetical protein D6E12_11165, partial [Desulfovibrio sp.]
QMLLMLARVYYSEENLGLAADALEEYLELIPEDFEARQDFIDVLIQDEQYSRALGELAAIDEQDVTLSIRYYKAKVHIGLFQYDEAAAILEGVVAENPDVLEAWVELAFVYELKKDNTGAERTYRAILDMGETSQELVLRLIDLNLKLEQVDKALALVADGPDSSAFFFSAATLFMDFGFYDEAEDILLPLLEQEPAPLETHFYLALLEYEGREDPEAAIGHLQQIPEGNEHFDRSLRFQIHLLYEAGDHDASLDLAEEARAAYPEQRENWILHIRLLQDREEYARSVEVAEQALGTWAEDPELHYLLGVALDLSGQRTRAMEIMEATIVLDPEYPEALNYVGYTLADEDRDLERALDLVERALVYKPQSGYIVDSLAWVFFRMGELDQAWSEIQRAVTMVDDDPVIWEHYGDIAAALGLDEEARKGWEKALDGDPENPAAIREKLDQL